MAVQGLEDRNSVRVGNGNRGNRGNGVVSGRTGDTGLRGIARSSWVAGARAEELHTSTLNTAGVTGRAVGVLLVSILLGNGAIIARVSVDDGANGAKFLSTLDLQATEESAVLDDDNLASQVNASVNQILVVLERAVVGIDKRAGDVAAGRVPMEGWDAAVETSRRVVLEDILGERGVEGDAPGLGVLLLLQQGETVVKGVVEVGVVGDNGGLDAPFLPLIPSPLSLWRMLVNEIM